MKSKSNPFLRHFLVALLTFAAPAANAANTGDFDWTGAANNKFTDSGNWVGGTWDQWSDYRFGGTPTTTSITINDYFGIDSLNLQSGLTTDIVINSTTTFPVIMGVGTADGNPLALISIDTNSKNLTINGDYIANGAVTWDVGAGRTFTLNGPLNNWNAPTSLVKDGDGTAVLNGASNYSGLTNINAGTLVASNNSALGPGGFNGATMTFIKDGATLALQGGISLDEHFHVWGSGVGSLGAVRSISGNNALTSSYLGGAGYALRSNTTVGVDADTLSISGFYEEGGSFSLTKVGAGTLALTTANTYSGATNVNGGVLQIGGGGTLGSGAVTIASGAVLELGVASGQTNFAATTFSGDGVLKKTGIGEAIWAQGATVFSLGSGALIDVQGGAFTGGAYGNENWSANLADLHVASGAAFHGVEANVCVDALTGAGILTSGYPGAGYAQFTFGVDGGSGTFSGVLADGAAPGNFVKGGTGTQILTGANTYSGATTINAGTLQIGDGGTSGTLGSGPVSIASGATLTIHRSDDYSLSATQIISGAGSLIKDGSGTFTLSGRNTYSGTTTVKNGVLALANQAALGEGPLNISSGAKVALNFTGQCFLTQLTLGGAVQAAGTYGSSGSSATNKNDTWFSGTGVINVSATIDHVAIATSNLQAADAAWATGDWAAVRSALSNVFNDQRLDAQWRSIPHLRYARSFQATGDYAAASATFGTIATITEYPKIHQIEGAECKTECDRLAQALPARDPEANRVRVTPAPAPGRVLHVAPNGNDANPGTLGQPFATVNQALAANRAAGAVAGGTAIELAAGRYPLTNSIALTSADSGTSNAPLSIRAATPGTAVISGSQRLTGFTAVTDASILARLPVEAQGKVMQCNLSALGITDFGSIQEQPVVNLSVNGVPQTLARWPNSGFIPIGGMVDNGNIDQNNPSLNRPQIFNWSGDRASRWTTAPDAWIQGYLGTNWLYGSVAIGSIDPQAKTITTAWCYNRLSGWPDMKSGAPYSVFNLLEEIDQPGEWYLDRTNGMLYWYPSADSGTAVVDFSILSGSMLTATNASHVRIEGLVFESSRGTGVELENSSNCLIAGCTVRNLSGIGVRINGGQQNSMISCDLHDLEQAACHINGGDGNTLTPGNHLLANCRFRNFGRISRSAGISLNGVGHRITHCVFEDCPSSAIGFGGFNFLVEYNEFRNCCNEIDDYGVIYAWGNPTWRGNIWRFNKFSHCGGGYTQGWVQNRYFGTSAFRFDDAVSGQTVYGNVFTHFDLWGASAGVMGNNSGRDNIYDNNLVTDCRGLNYGYYDPGNHMYLQGVPNGLTPAQLAAFPELANLYDGKGQNYLWRSTTLRVSDAGTNAGNSSYADSEWGGWQYIANTHTGTDPGFVDGVEVKKTIDPTLFWNLGMRAIPVDEIGLYNDATRAAWIDNPGMAYWNGSSGNWDASTVNWSASTVTPAGMAWNDNGDTSAVFAGTGGTVTLAAPLSANGLIFTAPGYTLAGTQPIALNGALTTLDAKTFGATISAPLTGLGGISVAGSGTLTLSGSNSYNGTTTVKSGTLALSGGDNRLPTGTVVTLGGGGPAAVGSLKLNGCNQELAGLWTAGHNSDAGNRVINGSATPCTLTLNIENDRNNQFVGMLGGGGQNENNFAVSKTGGGTLWLNRSITWTGGTTIEDGTLELNSSWWQGNEAYGTFRIGKGATFAVSGRVSPLTFKGVTVEFLSAGGGTLIHRGSPDWMDWRAEWGLTIRSTGGERNLFSAPPGFGMNLLNDADFDIARGSDATCDLLVSIPLTGNGGITKLGNGIMTLSGANSYAGQTEIIAGTLQIGDGGNAGSLPNSGIITNNANLTINRSDALTVSNVINGTGSLTKIGAGTLSLSGNNTYSGGTTIHEGTVTASGLGSGAVTIASGATLSTTSSASTGLAALYYNNSVSQANIATLPALLAHFGSNSPAPSLVNTATSMNFAGDGSGFPSPYDSGALGFEAFYSGKINIATAGTYTFNTGSDDGSMLFIDGQVVVTNNFDQPFTTRSGSIALSAGMHDIIIAYNQGGGGYGMNAQMSGADDVNMVDINTGNTNITPDLVVGSLAGEGNVTLTTGNLITGIDNISTSFSGTISGIGSVTKFGTGVQTLVGTNTYTGASTINGGKLIVSGSLNNTSSVNIATGAELEISGTLAASGNIVNNGTLVLTGSPQLSAGGTITNNGTLINRAPGYTLPANLVNTGTVYNLPATPAGLSATAGNSEVVLSWSAVSGASSYQVKQSAFAGGPYTTIATPTGTSHTATGLTNGSIYYFVVSASNTAGESANSAQVSATPQALLPLPRQTMDIGNVGLTGSAVFSGGTYTLQGAGTGITGTADACRFVYQTASGDCSATFRVQSLSTTGSGTKVGVMIRESLAANAREAGVWVSPGNGILFTRRTSTGGTTAVTASTGKTAPYWVRLTRTGNVFQAFYSTNGSSWTQFGSNRTISMAATTYIGIATTSGTTATLCTGVLTNESVVP